MYDMRVSCDVNYYGGNCSKLCKPQDHESFGHFTCSETGDIICLSGWQDKDKYCTIRKYLLTLFPFSLIQNKQRV